MNLLFSVLMVIGSGFLTLPETNSKAAVRTNQGIETWITSPLDNILFQKQNTNLRFETTTNSFPSITIDAAKTYQTIDGFGNCLTGGSALVLNRMDKNKRAEILKELFSTKDNNIGISYLRISIGASDLSDHLFTYDEMPAGQTDVNMEKFSMEAEKTDLIPVLKEILAINPHLKIMGSPWTAPTWMKTNQKFKGGSLKPECYDAYARYFVKYIHEMKTEGIPIDAITIQNEPLHPGNTPSMYMPASEQAVFIKKSLGPAFKAAGVQTKIIVYDHNANRIDYPLEILNDREAAQYVDGSAFHLYEGTIDELSKVHQAHPSKNLYFTEQWVGAPGNLASDLSWHVRTLIIGATRNWCRNVLEWNMASDPHYDPHTSDGGCDQCLGTITIDGNKVTRNPAYYILAHAAKFVRPGSVRIDSNLPEKLPNVAFKTPDNRVVLIVINDHISNQQFNISYKGKTALVSLPQGAVGTFIW